MDIFSPNNILSAFKYESSKIWYVFAARLTEYPEQDVYVCESKYMESEKSIKKLGKGLKVKQPIWYRFKHILHVPHNCF